MEDCYILIYEKKLSSVRDMIPLLEKIYQLQQAAPHHRRRRRKRSAGGPRRQSAPQRPARVRRRSPPASAIAARRMLRRHRDAHRRPVHQRRSRPEAGEHRVDPARQGQDGHRGKGKLHDRQRRRQEGGHHGPHRSDPRPDEPDRKRIRQGKIQRTARQADRRRGDHPRRGGDRSRHEAEEGPRRRRPARHPRGGRGRHSAGRRRGA